VYLKCESTKTIREFKLKPISKFTVPVLSSLNRKKNWPHMHQSPNVESAYIIHDIFSVSQQISAPFEKMPDPHLELRVRPTTFILTSPRFGMPSGSSEGRLQLDARMVRLSDLNMQAALARLSGIISSATNENLNFSTF
jgi:hypothetical protein